MLALNEPLELGFDAALDALAVTPRAVRVETSSGQPLELRRSVEGSRLLLELRVDQQLLDDPPPGLRVHLAGLPSPHALRGRDGACLETAMQVDVKLQPRLEAGAERVRLVSVDGLPVASSTDWPHDDRLELGFAGVLDPSHLQPEGLPLFPLAQGLPLSPVLAPVRWLVQGERTSVVLDLAGLPSPLALHAARVGWRGLDGQPPEMPSAVTLVRR